MALSNRQIKKYNKGLACFEKEKYKEAIKYFNEILSSAHDYYSYLHRAYCYWYLEKYEDAVKDATLLLQSSQHKDDACAMLGRLYYKLENFNGAITFLSKAIKVKPDIASHYDWRGLAYLDVNEYENAIADFNLSLILNPEEFTYFCHQNRGEAYYLNDQFEEALSDFNIALLEEPSAEIYSKRAKVYIKTGKLLEAYFDLSAAIELNPNDPELYTDRAKVSFSLGSIDHALEDTNKAITLNPSSDDYAMRGKCFLQQGKITQAITELTAAIKLEDDNDQYYAERARIYSGLQSFNEAIFDYEKAININQKNDKYFSERGRCYLQLGEYKLAISDFNRAIELNPHDSFYYAHRAEALKMVGKSDLARCDKASSYQYRKLKLFNHEGRLCIRHATEIEEQQHQVNYSIGRN